ncbi:MAG: hypothetical protein Q9167_004476 [Letrouitia subvulpina]
MVQLETEEDGWSARVDDVSMGHNGYRVWTATLLSTAIGVVFGGIQALLILTLRGPYNDGVEWPMILVGVIAAILLAAGLVPPYFEIAKRSGRIVGISLSSAIDLLLLFGPIDRGM